MSRTEKMAALPIQEILPQIIRALDQESNLVIQAPPGAGKTTGVPLALLGQPWLGAGRIIMLEPRRLAARAAARRMADVLGEPVGERVGYRIRFESKVGPNTRVEVVTEGILTRMILDDPSLDGVGLVIFDEFHERSLQADLGLALCLEAKNALREDLKLVVMSATLDGQAVSKLLGDAPILTSEGRAFPVETIHLQRPDSRRFVQDVAQAVGRAALETEDGHILVFLPGQGEIRRVEAALDIRGFEVAALYGDLTQAEQDRALRADGSVRRVILSTAIAETSLTIEGVRVVVDAGLMRMPRYDPVTGMTRLVTGPVSRASADQRRGRAGRLGPGTCYRLWSAAEDRALAAASIPEILETDLAPLMLDLAAWGVRDVSSLAWMDQPPAAAIAEAKSLLTELGALDQNGGLTKHGGRMQRLGTHPRLAHMMLAAEGLELRGLACDLAALLSERDILKARPGFRDADLRLRIEALRSGKGYDGLEVDRGALARVRDLAKDGRSRLRLQAGAEAGIANEVGLLAAFAYPDRIAKRRGGEGFRFQVSGGGGAVFSGSEPLVAQDYLVIPELDGDRREAKVFLAAPISLAEIETHFADHISWSDQVRWDRREQVVTQSSQRRLGALVLVERRLDKVDPEQLAAAMVEGVRTLGLACLPWTKDTQAWCDRVRLLARLLSDDGWPDTSESGLLATLEHWLAPFLSGVTRKSHLDGVDLRQALDSLLDWQQKQRLDELAPTHVAVPTGNRIALDYSGDKPVLAVRLQEMFGCADGPRIANGKMPVLLHLLSPARRPLQVTDDLAGFWANTYHAVKSEMKGQYPRHWWPDDPMQAEPTARAKPRGK